MRRTGYPECMTGEGTIDLGYTDGKFIARYAYPQIAVANNRANYEAAFAEQGATLADNNMILPVWWSGQASPRMPVRRGSTPSVTTSLPTRAKSNNPSTAERL